MLLYTDSWHFSEPEDRQGLRFSLVCEPGLGGPAAVL